MQDLTPLVYVFKSNSSCQGLSLFYLMAVRINIAS